MIKKAIIYSILITLILITTGLSCIPGQQSNSNAPQITLTVWRLFDDAETFAPIIKDFEKDNPNVKINYVKKDFANYEASAVDALAADEGPDIWEIRNDWMPKHYKKLTPMPDNTLASALLATSKSNVDAFKDAFAPIAAQENTIDGKIYGLPLSVDTLALIYNLDLFHQERGILEQSGAVAANDTTLLDPPGDWEEVIKDTKLLTKKSGGNITQAGIALGTANNVDKATDILYALMLQNGTSMISADKLSATFNLSTTKQTGSPVYPGTQALDFYTSFSNPSKETYSWNSSMPSSVDAFINGKVAMIIDYAFQKNAIAQAAPTLNFNVAPLPQIKGVTQPVDFTSYWVETVTKKCQHADIAWKFIEYAAGRSLTSYTQATKRPTPLKMKQESVPEVTQRVQQKSMTFDFQVNSAESWYKGLQPMVVDQLFSTMIDNVVSHGQPEQAAIDATAAEVTKLLKTE